MISLIQHFSDSSQLLWAALFPITYVIHIVEEYCAGEGYSTHLLRNYDIDLSPTRFLILQTVGLISMTAGLILATSLRFPNTMLMILASIVLSNGTIHLVRSIANSRYEPGLISGIVLWFPLGLATFYLTSEMMTTLRMIVSAAIGLGVSGSVELLTLRGGKLVNS